MGWEPAGWRSEHAPLVRGKVFDELASLHGSRNDSLRLWVALGSRLLQFPIRYSLNVGKFGCRNGFVIVSIVVDFNGRGFLNVLQV